MGFATTIADRLAAHPLVALVRQESKVSLRRVVAMAAISSLSNVLALAIVNRAAEETSREGILGLDLVLFLLAIAVYNVSQRHILITAVVETEEIVSRIRVRIADKVRRADLADLEAAGRAGIFTGVTRDSVTLSNTSPMIVIALQSIILVFFIGAYLAYLSIPAFLLAAALTTVAIRVYVTRSREAFLDLGKASVKEYEFFDALSDTLDGFKEAKLNRARSDELFAHVGEVSQTVKGLKADVLARLARLSVFGATSFYLLMAAMVFVLPGFSSAHSEVVVKSTAAVLFLIGPLTALGNVMPVIAHAAVAASNVTRIEAALDRHADRPAPEPSATFEAPVVASEFREIRFERLVFEYHAPGGEVSFRLGPVDFTLAAGETVFLVGGNGSGKSTLLLVLTGLYTPSSGTLSLDGRAVDAANVADYRSLFATVLSDYHLFKRLYGLGGVSAETVEALLRELDIGEKTRVVDRRFETVDLSTGQRKRLALAVALLEDRPIYVFDEWAAEQDAEFRARFYSEILPQLKARGKTVLVVTHDDRYFRSAVIDRVVKLEQGQFVPFVDAGGGAGEARRRR